jgi:serine/threonine-protein phosphatase 2A regulatory subunit B'
MIYCALPLRFNFTLWLSVNVSRILHNHDPDFFAECSRRFQEETEREKTYKAKTNWRRLEEIASAKATSGEVVLVRRGVLLGIVSS